MRHANGVECGHEWPDFLHVEMAQYRGEHVTDDEDHPLICWCKPYRDADEPQVIIHRKEGEA